MNKLRENLHLLQNESSHPRIWVIVPIVSFVYFKSDLNYSSRKFLVFLGKYSTMLFKCDCHYHKGGPFLHYKFYLVVTETKEIVWKGLMTFYR